MDLFFFSQILDRVIMSLQSVFFFPTDVHRNTKIFYTDKAVFSHVLIFPHCSRASCPFWRLSKRVSALTFFRAVSLSLSLHVRHPMRIQNMGLQVSACHFLAIQFLSSAMPTIPQFSSLFFVNIAKASRAEVTSPRKRACLVCLSGLWRG